MGRHRHDANVRADGLAAVLGPLVRDERVRAAVLVDVDSGMVLDSYVLPGYPPGALGGDVELIGAAHAEVMRAALTTVHAVPGAGLGCDLQLSPGGGRYHLLRAVADPHGDRLALSVVVDGSARFADRVRRRLGEVSAGALTAGPSAVLRPGPDGWAGSGIPSTAIETVPIIAMASFDGPPTAARTAGVRGWLAPGGSDEHAGPVAGTAAQAGFVAGSAARAGLVAGSGVQAGLVAGAGVQTGGVVGTGGQAGGVTGAEASGRAASADGPAVVPRRSGSPRPPGPAAPDPEDGDRPASPPASIPAPPPDLPRRIPRRDRSGAAAGPMPSRLPAAAQVPPEVPAEWGSSAREWEGSVAAGREGPAPDGREGSAATAREGSVAAAWAGPAPISGREPVRSGAGSVPPGVVDRHDPGTGAAARPEPSPIGSPSVEPAPDPMRPADRVDVPGAPVRSTAAAPVAAGVSAVGGPPSGVPPYGARSSGAGPSGVDLFDAGPSGAGPAGAGRSGAGRSGAPGGPDPSDAEGRRAGPDPGGDGPGADPGVHDDPSRAPVERIPRQVWPGGGRGGPPPGANPVPPTALPPAR